MVIAIETFMSADSGEAELVNNYLGAVVTKNDAYACYWEHVAAVTDTSYETLDLHPAKKQVTLTH